ncbi:MAG: hypothetical protein JWL70_1854 [Acidimicrobiia bacterium]|nr:hypothetical protein [Acidimicrobiia bacterium]
MSAMDSHDETAERTQKKPRPEGRGIPGASDPGEPGYEGDMTVGDESVQVLGDDVEPFATTEPAMEDLSPEVQERLRETDRLLAEKERSGGH